MIHEKDLIASPTIKALEVRVAQLEEDLAMANFFIDERHRQRNEANLKVIELENELETMLWKLGEGTLHELHCNGNHNKRVGAADTICNCALGQEIKRLRFHNENLKLRLEGTGL